MYCAFSLDIEQVQQALDGEKPRPATVPQLTGSSTNVSRSQPSKLADEQPLKPPEPQKRKRAPKAKPKSDSKSPIPKIEVTFQEPASVPSNDLDTEHVYDNAVPVAPKRRHRKSIQRKTGL